MALIAVIGIGSLVGSNAARDDLTPKAYKALVQAGLSNVKVDFDGREAKLSNGSSEELARAEKIVEGVSGVRWADIDSGKRSSLPPPPTFSLARTAYGVNLSGVVPNAAVAAQLKAAVVSTFTQVSGGLTVDRNVGTAEWLSTLPALIPNVAGVRELTLSVDRDSLSIGGALDSQAEIDTLAELVNPAFADLSFDNNLKIAPSGANSSAASGGQHTYDNHTAF